MIAMNIEVVIREAILRLEARAEVIKAVIYANPFQEIIDLRQQVKEAIAVNGYSASISIINTLAGRERLLLNQARQQKRKSSELILELVDVDMQIDEFKKALYQLTLPELLKKQY